MTDNRQGSTLVVGIGNEFRKDDGAGAAVARALQSRLEPPARILQHSGEAAALMDAWEGADSVFLVDAVQTGGAAGAVHRFDAREQPLPAQVFRCSTHVFSVSESIELARALDRLPPRLIVYGIEGADFGSGPGLSPAVARAVETAAARIQQEIDSRHEPFTA